MSRLQYSDFFMTALLEASWLFRPAHASLSSNKSIQPLSAHLMLGPVRRFWILCTVPYARAIALCACGALRARDMGRWHDGVAGPTCEWRRH
jgi:hypothetical protein